jgi:hypothetical protein
MVVVSYMYWLFVVIPDWIGRGHPLLGVSNLVVAIGIPFLLFTDLYKPCVKYILKKGRTGKS